MPNNDETDHSISLDNFVTEAELLHNDLAPYQDYPAVPAGGVYANYKKWTERIRTYTRELAKRLNVIGLMNAQFAVQGDRIYLIEVNPRASRTVPFISKAVGKPLAKLAVDVMMGKTLKEIGGQSRNAQTSPHQYRKENHNDGSSDKSRFLRKDRINKIRNVLRDVGKLLPAISNSKPEYST